METVRCWEEWRPAMAMLAVDVAFGVMNILVKKALDEGLNCLVLITLRQLTATVFMAPIAFFRERKSRPKLTWWILVQLFFSALLGASLTQYLFFLGLQYTSATFACAFLNMAPVFTFLIALPFRMERVNLKTTAGTAKVVATAVCVCGAAILMFYKGIPLTNTTSLPATAKHVHLAADHHENGTLKWTLGSLCLIGGAISWSAWFLVQTKIGKSYPALYSSTTLMFFLSFLQAAALTLATQGSALSVWTLKGKVEIGSVLYAGVMGSGVGFLVMSWCVGKRGPVFTAAFSPLIQIVVAIIDYALEREPLYLGNVMGSAVVVFGLYILLWGMSKDEEAVAAAGAAAVAGSCDTKPKPVEERLEAGVGQMELV